MKALFHYTECLAPILIFYITTGTYGLTLADNIKNYIATMYTSRASQGFVKPRTFPKVFMLKVSIVK